MRRPTKKNPVQTPAIPFKQCPAKTYASNGETVLGRSVASHCTIVGLIAKTLRSRMPNFLKESLFPEGAALIAACHDIGKVSPTFAEKLFRSLDQYQNNSHPSLVNINPKLEEKWGGHSGVSQLVLNEILDNEFIPKIVGQHHGFKPPVAQYTNAHGEVFGDENWHQERIQLIEYLKNALKSEWPEIKSKEQALAIAGLVSVADWIGSGKIFDLPDEDYLPLIERSINNAGFVAPKVKNNLDFKTVFNFEPYLSQQKLIDVANQPGVYILEAQMGSGKTEAALFAAYTILSKKQASGIYFALPTQLTSNKIYERFNQFLNAILHDDCVHHKSLLLHGNRWLMAHTQLGKEGEPGKSWFNASKRGLLAPFAVGTIDQALMAVMNVKHGFVRAFGLAGKIVILDEVHSYDIYTGTILNELVATLKRLQCTVIILSATLSFKRREMLLNVPLQEKNYPLISALQHNDQLTEIPLKPPQLPKVSLIFKDMDFDAATIALNKALNGEYVLWIENTVNDAQERYLDLAARCKENNISCGLLHSRFTASDRQMKEDQWISVYGKSGADKRLKNNGHILIGTQVLEQSLDIDADFLISRFCPTDMLLQRIGRLWRHKNTKRAATATCEALILAPSLDKAIENPYQHFSNTAFVYSPYVLCRSLEVWQTVKLVDLKTDIRELIEKTYQERTENNHWLTWQTELREGNQYKLGTAALQRFANLTLSSNQQVVPEITAQTRYSEVDNVDVLLCKCIEPNAKESETLITLLNGETVRLPWKKYQTQPVNWRALTVQLMEQVVQVSIPNAPREPSRKTLEKLGFHHCFYLGKPQYDEACFFRVVCVDDDDALTHITGEKIHDQYLLKYNKNLGYRVIKQQAV